MHTRLRCLALFVVAATLSGQAAPPDSEQDETDAAREVHDWADDQAQHFELHSPDNDEPLTLQPGSLLRWSNPIVGELYGDSYLWTDRGRPAAFLSVYVFLSPKQLQQMNFQSLATGTLLASYGEQTVWEPNTGGIEYEAIADVPAPARSAAARLAQMRSLARGFRAEVSEREDPNAFRELRLLTRPLYRYESSHPEILDGALFAFVDSTDPELLLLVEAERTDSGSRWIYAPGRQNHRRLRLHRDDRLIWDAPQLAPPFSETAHRDRPFYTDHWATFVRADEAVEPGN